MIESGWTGLLSEIGSTPTTTPTIDTPTTTPTIDTVLVEEVLDDIRQQIRQMIDDDGDESGENRRMLGGLVRLSFHDCVGERCDGCINNQNPENAGLCKVNPTACCF